MIFSYWVALKLSGSMLNFGGCEHFREKLMFLFLTGGPSS